MSDLAAPAIQLQDLTKVYELGEHLSLHRTVTTLLRRRAIAEDRFAAIDGVTFDVARGECLGLLGGNGSGKSTILQIISGVTLPTGGSARVTGRVLPLLEIGAGFHPELTGTENVMLFGTVLGLSFAEIRASLPAVAGFAGIERHMETPLKRYSAGMKARLSFAIAMRFDADIYIFDEVLAVVDDTFRALCLDEIQGLLGRGRTVLFVSHDHDQVERVCDRVVWLERGRVHAMGPTADVLPDYHALAPGQA